MCWLTCPLHLLGDLHLGLKLVEKLGEHLKGKETEKEIRSGIVRGFVELNEQV